MYAPAHPLKVCQKVLAVALLLLGQAGLVLGQPAIVPDNPVMNLDELGVYAVGYAYRSQAEQQFPLGWSGFFETATGVACQPAGTQNTRRAFLLHCPWRGGTGLAFQQFTFSLPASASRILLRGAAALRTDIVGQSDGAVFRVFINGQKQLDVTRTNDVWLDFEYDLTSLKGGTNVMVRFETDPGAKNNASFDYSLWGRRELVLEGFTPAAVVQPPPPPLDLSRLAPTPDQDVAPAGGFPGTNTVRFTNDTVYLGYAGPDGSLEYQWQRPLGTLGFLGRINLQAQMIGQPPIAVPLANSASLTWTQTASAGTNGWAATNGTYALVRQYSVAGSNVLVRITGRMLGKSLVFEVTASQPYLNALDLAGWGPVLRLRPVVAPYCPTAVFHLPNENLFVSAFLDWGNSAASAHSGTVATYSARTDGTRTPASERVIFVAAWHLAEVFPNLPSPPSPHLDFLANKVVLDIWGGSFGSISSNLATLADYGLTNAIAIVHNWQRSGYDNALPMHYPANASLGGDFALASLLAAGQRSGIRVALHENYVDYYPNYDFYDTNEIALNSSGGLVNAWLNEGTGIQSYAVKPAAILPLAATQSPEIHRRYSTRASYLDVHSAVPPWFHVDARAGEAGAGTFRPVWNAHRQLFAYERATHDGPVFGEGNRHAYWSGCLDGVEAQFGTGWPANGGMEAPLQVEFDLLRMHPLQLNHGMGYYVRWWPEGHETNWAGSPPMVVLDQYRLQQVAYGHAGFLGGEVYASVPLAWLEHHLVSPVSARHATARAADIQYEFAGSWLDVTAAAKAGAGTTNSRVRIFYANGLVITGNGARDPLAVGPWTLPQFGWLAEGAGLQAGTVLRDGVVVDFADSGNSCFANARPAADWNLSSFRRVQPSVTNFLQTAARAFRFTYQWNVQEVVPRDYRCFVHFLTNATIRWQQDHSLAVPTSVWPPGQNISDGPWTLTLASNVADGDYVWSIGLYDPGDGSRLRLSGVDDGSSRIRLGLLQVRTNGASISFVPETGAASSDPSSWYQQHLNSSHRIVDFGSLRTDGSVLLRRDGPVWTLQTWPRHRSFTLELDATRFPPPPNVWSVGGTNATVLPVPAGSRWRLPLNGGREYRWSLAGVRPASLVPAGATWRYLEDGSDPGAAWRSNAFNEAGWKTGPAELGFGEAAENRPEATVVARTNAYGGTNLAWYFRRSFLVPDPARIQSLAGRLLRDDGAAVYLNGAEVWRDNLPAGALSSQSLALAAITGTAETNWLTNALSPALLLPGTNLLAVEVHQNTNSSSDLSFDFELTAQVLAGDRPPLSLRLAGGRPEVRWPADAGFYSLYAATSFFPVPTWQRITNEPRFDGSVFWFLPPSDRTNPAVVFQLRWP
jgi:hypothetical protein